MNSTNILIQASKYMEREWVEIQSNANVVRKVEKHTNEAFTASVFLPSSYAKRKLDHLIQKLNYKCVVIS